MTRQVSKALLHLLDHDVLGEGFMDTEITGTERYALARAYNKLSQGNTILTGFEAELVERAVENFKGSYTPLEQIQIQSDMEHIRHVQWEHTPPAVKRLRARSKHG